MVCLGHLTTAHKFKTTCIISNETFQKFLIPHIKEEPDNILTNIDSQSDDNDQNEHVDKDDQDQDEQRDRSDDKYDIIKILKLNCRRSERITAVKSEK